jgi:hypothetical protein
MRVRPALLLATLAVLGLPALGSPARAEDRAPADLAERTAAAFPAPAAEHGFEWSCYVLRAGAPHGRLLLSARPDRVDGKPVWRVRDVRTPLRPGGDRVETEAVLDARLGCLNGRYHLRNAQGFVRTTWQRTEDGRSYAFDTVTTEYENKLVRPAPRAALATLSGWLLFLRLAPARAGTYVIPDLDADRPGSAPLLVPGRLDVHRVAPWRVAGETRDAWIASLTRGKRSARIALAKEGRAFLGMTVQGLPFQYVPEGSGPVGLADPDQAGVATPIEHARARTRALRARLPMPCSRFAFKGYIRHDDTIVGSVSLSAVPACFEGRPSWEVTEAHLTRTGEAVVRRESTGFVGRDLRVLRGEQLDHRPEGRRVSTYVRKGDRIETVHALDGARGDPIQATAPEGAITGLVPVLLFLRQVPSEPARYVLPGWDPRYARAPKTGYGGLPTDVSDVYVEVRGDARLRLGGWSRRTWMAVCSQHTGHEYEVHLEPGDRSLVAVVGRMPRLTIAPRGVPGMGVTWYDAVEGPPKSARQAFVKFGRGYHRPRRDLLADVFHWPSMRAVAIARGQYPAGVAEDEVREAWIDVFVKMSKHRTAADCDDLLFQMFMTSVETENDDGSVSMATLPAYGGHTYRMKEIGGRWYIVQID